MEDKKPLIQPVSKDLLKSELTKNKLLRKSNFGNTEIYIFTHKESPNLMLELGRLRELTFRTAGGGTGKEADIDKYDTADDPYIQLIVWDPDELEIIGGYRFILGESILDDYISKLATANLFEFSDDFLKNYLPYTIELGRSFVQPAYQQGANRRKGLFALDNLWDGLGALTIEYPEMKYFFGKVTMYKHFNFDARSYILSFLKLYFGDKQNLIKAKSSLSLDYEKYSKEFSGNNYEKEYKKLQKIVKDKGERIPPLVNAYMNLSSSMISFETVDNQNFGGVEETAILININDIYNSKKDRHVKTYSKLINLSKLLPRRPKILRLKRRK